jgi:hypothetical protein
MHHYQYALNHDATLNAAAAARAEWRMVLGVDGVSMLVTDDEGRVLRLEGHGFENAGSDFLRVLEAGKAALDAWNASVNGLSFRQRHLALFHPAVTLVPRRLFQAEALPVYFRLLLPEGNYHYAFDALPELDCYLVYAVEPQVLELTRTFFPGLPVQHLATALLRSWRPATARLEHSVWVNVRPKHLQVMVFDRQNLQFYNTFACDNPADAAYFSLVAYEQFRLDPAQVPLHFAGWVNPDDALCSAVSRYVHDVRFATLPPGFLWPASAGFPPHVASDVFSLT